MFGNNAANFTSVDSEIAYGLPRTVALVYAQAVQRLQELCWAFQGTKLVKPSKAPASDISLLQAKRKSCLPACS